MKVGQWVGNAQTFIGEVKTELLKCNWPTKPELLGVHDRRHGVGGASSPAPSALVISFCSS
jgi:hypothetical protein